MRMGGREGWKDEKGRKGRMMRGGREGWKDEEGRGGGREA